MKLCIADPPYLGTAARTYGDKPPSGKSAADWNRDYHPNAAMWDNPDTHKALVNRLIRDYDGWAISMRPDNLWDYLQWVPRSTRIAVWHDPTGFPSSHPIPKWSPVLVARPPNRRLIAEIPKWRRVSDHLTATTPGKFVGRKPPQWTRWVLDMLGYNQDTDTVDDLFEGSGAVAGEIAQLVIQE